MIGGGEAGPDKARAARFSARRKPCADFEEAHIGAAVATIVADGVDKPRQQAGPHHGEFLRQGIGDDNGRLGSGERLRRGRFDEGEGDRFGKAHAKERRANLAIARDARI